MKQNGLSLSPSLQALSGKVALQVLHGAGEGIVVIDEHNRIVFFNAMAEKLWAYTQADVIGKNVSMLLPASLRDGHDAFVERNRSTGVNTIIGTSRPITLENRAGEPVAAELSLSVIEISPDGRKYYQATIRGLTEESHRNTLAGLQNTVFRALLSDMSVVSIAGFMCRELETYLPDMTATLLVVDDRRQVHILSGVGLPGRYATALEGITLSAHDDATLARDSAQATDVVWA
ncbi:PAS domain S-box protein [Komagataeibacter medellinensis]|uniref:PAS domain-containing protein n=1 Tax=Komagataeibacter medellinensis (strain NBRC 3288 / BCRC 11682 / LMG 1693 / Kondo 51) TaxID=634177 RepID=G2I467_KOMMN|nr:PAS domain S-box protein [Komagataeibacter medellinensis]BAK82914.1 hypothetical protein GLX_05020 [Komagataeibacter medellinensis NBRC 3288]